MNDVVVLLLSLWCHAFHWASLHTSRPLDEPLAFVVEFHHVDDSGQSGMSFVRPKL